MQHADVVVIGAGVAGLTAAMIAASHGVSTVVVEQLAPGGQVATIEKIGNFPGFPDGIAGYELGPLLQQQAEAAGAVVQLDSVSEIIAGDGVYRVICAEDEIAARAVIIAAGSSLRKLGISGEAEFAGRGVSHCASCDGPLFKGQSVVVAGGGDSAFDEALVLAGHACEVIVVHRGSHPSARASAVAQLVALPHVRMVADSDVAAIEGDTKVTGVAIRRGAGTEHKACRAVFAYIGLEPRSGFLRDLVATERRRPYRHRCDDAHLAARTVCRRRYPRRFGQDAGFRCRRCRHRGDIGGAVSAGRRRKQQYGSGRRRFWRCRAKPYRIRALRSLDVAGVIARLVQRRRAFAGLDDLEHRPRDRQPAGRTDQARPASVRYRDQPSDRPHLFAGLCAVQLSAVAPCRTPEAARRS